MKKKEPLISTLLFTLLSILWLGFFFHRSPSFSGSLSGGLLAVSGAFLMLFPLIYVFIKRIRWLKLTITKFISFPNLLLIHIYAGLIGATLALLHTGHKFQSPIGIALTAFMLIVVASGFAGRYLLSQISKEASEKRMMLALFQQTYQQRLKELTALKVEPALPSGNSPSILGRLLGFSSNLNMPSEIIKITESMSDLEYAIKSHEFFKRLFQKWLKLHLVISFFFYCLLGFHIWMAIRMGLRWFE